MKLIVTIDTEEDNWLPFNESGYTTENIRQILGLQRLFADVGIRPTYLTTYQVATNVESAAILREVAERQTGEIGTHCHPWNQPPFEEAASMRNSMLCNLPDELQIRKIETLHRTIQERIGVTPTAFRSGRWGYSAAVARALVKLGYKVDSSITAYTDWSAYFGPDFSSIAPRAYRFNARDIYREAVNGELLEIPTSVDYLQHNSKRSHRLYEAIRRTPLRHLRLRGLLSRVGWLNQVALSPEISGAADMIKLLTRLRDNQYLFATLWFHSSTLVPGLTPFVQNQTDADAFLARLRDVGAAAKDLGVESMTLTEAADWYDATHAHSTMSLPAVRQA